jgi:hypothetical protein
MGDINPGNMFAGSDEDAFLDVFFNPELAMKEMSEGFDKMRGSMVQRLDTVLQKLVFPRCHPPLSLSIDFRAPQG